MGIQINGQTDTISSTDGSLNIGGTVTVQVTGDATGLTGTPDITVGAVTASSATISGDLTVNGTTTTLDTTLTEVDKLEVGANNTTVGVAITQSGTGDILRLYDGATEVFSVIDGGKVGINKENPSAALSAYHATNNTVGIFESGDSVARVTFIDPGGQAHVGNEGDDLVLSVTSAASEALRITSNGFIGVGTANPRRHFHLHNSATATVGFQMTNGGTGESDDSQGFQLKVGSDGHAEIAQMENSNLRIFTNASERLRITSSGAIQHYYNTNLPVTDSRPILQLGYSVIGDDNSGRNGVTCNAYPVSGNNTWHYIGSSSLGASRHELGFGDHKFYTAAAGTRGNDITWSEGLRIDSSGQVIAGSATLNYQGTATPYNNNNSTLTGTLSIGLIGSHSAINWPSDHSNAVTTEPWYMMGRPHGTTDRWTFAIRPGSSNNRYNIIDCYNNANGTIESLRFGTNAGNEALRITSSGDVGISTTTPNDKLDVYGGSICKTGTGSNYSPHVIVRDSNGRIRYFEYYFTCTKGSNAGTATDAYILDITSIGPFFQTSFEVVYGTRLQSVSDATTSTCTKTFGVNRFNSGNVAVTDENSISVDSNSNTHADVTMDALSSSAVRLKVAFSSTLNGSSFCSGVLRAWGVSDVLEHESYQQLTFYNGI